MTTSPPGQGPKVKRSLTNFAKANPQHHNGRCWMCNIPERDEVHAAYVAGVPPKTIFLWLRDECEHPDVTYAKVHMHLQNRHYERTQ